jgi:hypothetical protein
MAELYAMRSMIVDLRDEMGDLKKTLRGKMNREKENRVDD